MQSVNCTCMAALFFFFFTVLFLEETFQTKQESAHLSPFFHKKKIAEITVSESKIGNQKRSYDRLTSEKKKGYKISVFIFFFVEKIFVFSLGCNFD